MATALRAELVKLPEPELPPLTEYDLIGFGSGIYWGKHAQELLTLFRRLPPQRGKQAFIFSTSGRAEGRGFQPIQSALAACFDGEGLRTYRRFLLPRL
jgi:hypothetical protein